MLSRHGSGPCSHIVPMIDGPPTHHCRNMHLEGEILEHSISIHSTHVNNRIQAMASLWLINSDIVDKPAVSPPIHCPSMEHQSMLLVDEIHKQTVKISRAGILHEPFVAMLPASFRMSLHTVHVT